MKNFLERLKICYHVLTKTNYVYFGLGKNLILYNNKGHFIGTNKSAFAEYDYIHPNYTVYTYNGPKSIKEIFWSSIKSFAFDEEQKEINKR